MYISTSICCVYLRTFDYGAKRHGPQLCVPTYRYIYMYIDDLTLERYISDVYRQPARPYGIGPLICIYVCNRCTEREEKRASHALLTCREALAHKLGAKFVGSGRSNTFPPPRRLPNHTALRFDDIPVAAVRIYTSK